jgi:hypothetical protein
MSTQVEHILTGPQVYMRLKQFIKIERLRYKFYGHQVSILVILSTKPQLWKVC